MCDGFHKNLHNIYDYVKNINFIIYFQIQEQLNTLKRSTESCGLEIEKTRQLQENHSINYYKHHQISGKIS